MSNPNELPTEAVVEFEIEMIALAAFMATIQDAARAARLMPYTDTLQ
jgi:hypothetical protein